MPFRVHWPKHADLRINNMRMNVARRNITHTLGANARDETVNISSVALSGVPMLLLHFSGSLVTAVRSGQ